MSKLSFRARALDATKPMPVFRSEEVPDLPDFAAINRAVPQMPTGMEKEEECEHHLQRAISAQQAFGHTVEHVIPTPEVFAAPDKEYDDLYPANYKISRQLIHMQLLAIEQDIPDYDMDSEDEAWLSKQSKQINLTPLKFEEMMDRLEKSSGQNVVQLKEAKLLLKEDDDLIIAVFDYWLNKRLNLAQPLIPSVKTEKRDGSTSNNPYVAFRRRTEKMQTRKNRKNDETSYEKMLKLRRDLSRAVNLLDLIKHREKTKQEYLKLTVDIYEKRYKIGDFSGQILNEVSALRHIRPPSTYLPINNVQLVKVPERGVGRPRSDEQSQPRRKREYKRRHRTEGNASVARVDSHEHNEYIFSSDEEASPVAEQASDQEEQEEDPDGPYSFKRKKGCMYHSPHIDRLGNWPWVGVHEGGTADRRYRYCLTSLSQPKPRCIGFARRRYGRGGRVVFDRAYTPLDDYWSEFSKTSVPNGFPCNEFISEIRNEWLHFRPRTPLQESSNLSSSSDSVDTVEYDADGNMVPVVQINSLKEYVDDIYSASNEIDLASFQSHQEELFEMQRKQMERLKGADCDDSNSTSKSGNNLCNSEHSSKIISCAPSPSNSNLNVNSTNTQTWNQTQCGSQCHQTSLAPQWTHTTQSLHCLHSSSSPSLDSASVQFAVSVVRSANDVTNSVTYNNSVNTVNNVSSLSLSLSLPSSNSLYLNDNKTNSNSNGPIDNDFIKRTNSELSQPSQNDAKDIHNQNTTVTTASHTCKLKYQNRSQNTSLPPTDVT